MNGTSSSFVTRVTPNAGPRVRAQVAVCRANPAGAPPLNRLHRVTDHAAEAPSSFGAWHWFWLLVATATAAWLRLWNLGEWSLWIDEAHTWRDATMPWDGLDSERKLYSAPFLLLRGLLARGWIEGDAWSLRLPFAIVGIVTVPLMALCSRRLLGAWPAVLAAWLCALNPWHVYWSQNARGYVLVFVFAMLAANRCLAYAVSQRPRDFYAAMIAIGLGTLCHPTGAMQAMGIVAFLLARRFVVLRGRVLAAIAVGALLLGMLLPYLVEMLPFQGFLRSKSNPSLLHLVQTLAYYYVPVVLLAGAGGLLLGWWTLGRDRVLLLACLWLVPFFVLMVIGGGIAKVTARYAICTLPVITWLAAFACARLAVAAAGDGSRRVTRAAAAAALPILLLVEYAGGSWAYHVERHGDRARWHEACEFAQQRAGARALRVLTVSHPTVLYYLRPRHWSSGPENPYPQIQVVPLIDWMIQKGFDDDERKVCEPGVDGHFRWHEAEAKKSDALFVVMVTLPELAEMDAGGEGQAPGAIHAKLRAEFDLVLHLPCWVGPKDESVYVFVPKGA